MSSLEERRVELRRLVDETRSSCLWFLRADYYPESVEEIVRTLAAIEKRADRDTYVRARRLREWFSPTSSAKSAAS